jgi:hypothetical protein
MVRRVVPNIATIDPSIGRDFYIDMFGPDVVMNVGSVVMFAAPGNPTAQLNLVRSDPSAPLPVYSIEVSDVEAR